MSARLRGDAVLLFITAVWGATFVVVKDALALADPFTFLALRFGLGAVVAFALVRRGSLTSTTWRNGAVLGVLLFVGYALQTFGLAYTTPERSAFITGLSVLLVPFVAFIVFRRAPGVAPAIGTVLAVTGLWVLTGAALGQALPLGDLLTFGCAVTYSFHVTLAERYSPGESPIALVSVQLLVTALASAACIPLGAPRFESSVALWGAVALTGIVASVLAISLQMWAQAKTPAVHAAIIFSLEPLFATLTSWVLGRGTMTPRELAGGAIMLGGVVIAQLSSAPRA